MANLVENIGHIITGYTDTSGTEPVQVPGLITWLTNVGNSLIQNEIFQILIAIILFILFFGLMVGLAKGVKGRKKGR